MLKLLGRNGKTAKLNPQEKLESVFANVINLGNLECAYLFSEEGLLIAGLQGRSQITPDQAAEIIYSVINAFTQLQDSPDFSVSTEVLIFSHSKRKINIRRFEAFQQHVYLVLIVPPGRTYRSHALRLIRAIKKISEHELQNR